MAVGWVCRWARGRLLLLKYDVLGNRMRSVMRRMARVPFLSGHMAIFAGALRVSWVGPMSELAVGS